MAASFKSFFNWLSGTVFILNFAGVLILNMVSYLMGLMNYRILRCQFLTVRFLVVVSTYLFFLLYCGASRVLPCGSVYIVNQFPAHPRAHIGTRKQHPSFQGCYRVLTCSIVCPLSCVSHSDRLALVYDCCYRVKLFECLLDYHFRFFINFSFFFLIPALL